MRPIVDPVLLPSLIFLAWDQYFLIFFAASQSGRLLERKRIFRLFCSALSGKEENTKITADWIRQATRDKRKRIKFKLLKFILSKVPLFLFKFSKISLHFFIFFQRWRQFERFKMSDNFISLSRRVRAFSFCPFHFTTWTEKYSVAISPLKTTIISQI